MNCGLTGVTFSSPFAPTLPLPGNLINECFTTHREQNHELPVTATHRPVNRVARCTKVVQTLISETTNCRWKTLRLLTSRQTPTGYSFFSSISQDKYYVCFPSVRALPAAPLPFHLLTPWLPFHGSTSGNTQELMACRLEKWVGLDPQGQLAVPPQHPAMIQQVICTLCRLKILIKWSEGQYKERNIKSNKMEIIVSTEMIFKVFSMIPSTGS